MSPSVNININVNDSNSNSNSNSIGLQKQDLIVRRDTKRQECGQLLQQKRAIERQMQLLSQELMQLDDEIERIEEGQQQQQQHQQETNDNDQDHSNVNVNVNVPVPLTMHPEEILPEPSATLRTTSRTTSSLTPTCSMKEDSHLNLTDPFTYSDSMLPPLVSQQAQSKTNQISPQCPFSVQQITDALQETFQIRQFRENQLGIIQTTLSGQDVFVIMRTGGGKSLTYQLPMALERPKITVVISPLLSLIQDQQEQTNQFMPGSCVSFTSGMGASEHTKNWQRVRDPEEGVGMILVTPEKVYKSNKLKSELQKLSEQGRLARFVIDECHCACQWGTSCHHAIDRDTD
jgi:hypothetical protein